MLRNLHRALGALMIAAACGGNDETQCGDGTCTEESEDTSTCPVDCPWSLACGDGTCAADESCSSCWPDCGECNGNDPWCGDGMCTGGGWEDCMSCVRDCGCGEGQRCYFLCPACTDNQCISANPLIDAIPGRWDLLEVDGRPPITPNTLMLSTDTTQPLCGYPDLPPGDACIRGFSGPAPILDGTRLYIPDDGSGITFDGQVLNEGTRIEYDYSDGVVTDNDVVWVKRE